MQNYITREDLLSREALSHLFMQGKVLVKCESEKDATEFIETLILLSVNKWVDGEELSPSKTYSSFYHTDDYIIDPASSPSRLAMTDPELFKEGHPHALEFVFAGSNNKQLTIFNNLNL